jgi:hypothetical protein
MYRLGLYGASITTTVGALLGTLTSSVFSFQWVSTQKVAIVSKVELFWCITTAFTTAQPVGFQMHNVRSYTVPCSGGTLATFATARGIQTGAYDSAFAATNFATLGAINIMNAGSGLTVGTGLIDQYPCHMWQSYIITTGSSPNIGGDYLMSAGDNPGTQAFWYRNNEGFVIVPTITLGAAGFLRLWCNVEWAEMPNQFY